MSDDRTIGQYRIESELGRGGMGVVYEAFDPGLNRTVAIKVLSDALAHDESVVERFVREAKSMAALNEPNIVQIYSIGEEAGKPFFVMEFVDGESLGARLKRDGKLPVAEARRIVEETCIGLQAAHERGVIHRDIKPGNLMLTASGRVKIADFGIAMVQDFSRRLTSTGEFVGTPGYLSPEVCKGEEVDHRSDIFALGIVLYEMLTGNIPFTESSPLGMMLEVVNAEIPDVRSVNAAVDDATCRILRRMIAKRREDRYQSCREILADLAEGPGAVGEPASAAAATMVSRPDGARPPPAPPPGGAETVLSEPALAAAAPAMPAAEPPASGQALVPHPPRRRGRLVAAVLGAAVLLGGAGGLYAFRDALFGEDRAVESRLALAREAGRESAPPGRTDPDAADAAGGGSDAAPPPGEPAPAGKADAPAGGSDTPPAEGAQPAPAIAGTPTAPPPTPASGDAGAPPEPPAASPDTAVPAGPAQAAAPATASTGGAAPAQAAAEARVGDRAAMTVATATAPERAGAPAEPPPPANPQVVVVGVGDPAIAGPVVRRLEDSLAREPEVVLLDAAFLPGIEQVAGPGGVNLPALARVLEANGADVLVLAEVEFLGETPLNYYGRSDTLYTVNVRVRSILVGERRPLGGGWSQEVQFTTLNARDKAHEAVDPHLADLRAQLGKLGG